MCQHFFNGMPMVQMLMTPAPSELTPLPETHILNSLYGLAYQGGFKQFSQNHGYLPFANQSVTPDALGLLTGQYMGQPLVSGSN